jgi:TRAP-type C4-dicarboxylate transport system substrate-binding protein
VSTIRAVLLLLTILGLAACAAPVGKSGSGTEPVRIRAFYGNGPGTVGGDVLDAVVRAARAGPVTFAPPAPGQEGETEALAALAGGSADLSVIRAGRLEEAGATSLAALQAPLTGWTEEQMRRVATAPLTKELLAGLDRIGLVGLAIVPGGLRHPVGYGATELRDLGAFAGVVIDELGGRTARDSVAALGARPVTIVGEPRASAVRDGELAGIVVSLLQPQAVDDGGTVTANLTLGAKFDVVVIRRSVFKSLRREQRHALADAVRAGVAAATAARPDEQPALERWCTLPGYGAVIAPTTTIAAVRARLQPVIDRIGSDPLGARGLAMISAAGAGTSPASVHACPRSSPAPATSLPRPAPAGDQHRIDGTWRIVYDAARLRAGGADEVWVATNQGTWTYRFAGGRGTARQPRRDQPDCRLEYVLRGARFWMTWEAANSTCEGVVAGTFTIEGDRLLLHVTADSYGPSVLPWDEAIFGEGFRRVG